MKQPASMGGLGFAAIGIVAVACCAGLPVAIAAVAAIGDFAFGGVVAAVLVLLFASASLVRRRRRGCRPSGAAR